MAKYKLIQRIILRSRAKVWSEAKREWDLTRVYYADRTEPKRCLCGHSPIVECCILSNRVNQNQVVIGNCCIRRFPAWQSSKLFAALRRVSEDPEKAPNQALIDLASRNGCLSKWEEAFMRDTHRKRRLTPRQRAKRSEINAAILDCLNMAGDPISQGQPF